MSGSIDTLKQYPSPKVEVACLVCGKMARYDRDDMVRAGGDRKLDTLLETIAKRWGCEKIGTDVFTDICGLMFDNLHEAPPPKAPNAYALAKGR